MRQKLFTAVMIGGVALLSGCSSDFGSAGKKEAERSINLNALEKPSGQSSDNSNAPVQPSEDKPSSTSQPTQPMNKKQYPAAPAMQIDAKKVYIALLHTQAGDITLALHAAETPITVNNFVFLSREGFYDGTIFHRVLKGFMIQGGDPLGNGTGGPGYQFDDEKSNGSYTRGIVAMANAGPDTNGSQFFIMHGDYPLQPSYVIFGEVVSGMETVDKIATASVKTGPGGEPSSPVTPVMIKTIDIREE